jgi:4-hydroxymandelate oxidase
MGSNAASGPYQDGVLALARRGSVPFRTLGDLEAAARRAVGSTVWGYIEGGAGEEVTVRSNRAAFDRWALLPRLLEDLRTVDLGRSLLGKEVAAPFFLAPTAYQRSVHRSGELATVRAASRRRVLALVSTLASYSLESIAAAAPDGPRWFQLYPQPRVEASIELVRRAERAGYSAIVLTADAPVLGSRDRQTRSGFAISAPVPHGNGPNVVSPPRPLGGEGPRYELRAPASASWELLDRLRDATSLPFVLKGVLTPDDARTGIAHGVRGIFVSNHGGRQLDRSPATLDVLPSIVEAVGDRAEVYLDGGVRRGSDVLVALALGARAVGLGRPPLWALAAGGEAGVERFLELLAGEVATSLAILGRRSVAEVDRSAVARQAP